MNLSPSAVSLQMKQLETYFGQPLFDRSALQVRPTAFAHEVCERVAGTLESLDSLRRRAAPAVSGKVRLGIIEPMQVTILPTFTALAREKYPELDIRLERGRSAALVDEIRAGRIDAAIVAQPEQRASSRLQWTPLIRERFVLIAPPDTRVRGIPALFRAYEWIRFDKGTIGGAAAARYIAKAAPEARSRLELLSIPAILAMVSLGLGVSILPEPDAYLRAAFPVHVVPLGDSGPSRLISFVTRKAGSDDRLVQALLECVQRASAARPG
jgi:DNA-binding transcriptional LysR family regulator